MASAFSVSSTQLKSAASKLQNYNAQFKQAVTQLVQYEQALNGQWEGDARKAFHTAFTNDKAQFDNFYNGIAKYVQILQEIAAKYNSAEDTNLATAKNRTYH